MVQIDLLFPRFHFDPNLPIQVQNFCIHRRPACVWFLIVVFMQKCVCVQECVCLQEY